MVKKILCVTAALMVVGSFISNAAAVEIESITPAKGPPGIFVEVVFEGKGITTSDISAVTVFFPGNSSYTPFFMNLEVLAYGGNTITARIPALESPSFITGDSYRGAVPGRIPDAARSFLSRNPITGEIKIIKAGGSVEKLETPVTFQLEKYPDAPDIMRMSTGAVTVGNPSEELEVSIGNCVDIYGTGFGAAPGSINFTHRAGAIPVFYLKTSDIREWTSTFIKACVPANYQHPTRPSESYPVPLGQYSLQIVNADRYYTMGGVQYLRVTPIRMETMPRTASTPQPRTRVEAATPTPMYEMQKPPPKLEAAPAQREYKTPMTTGSGSGKDKDKDKTDSSNTLGTSPSSSGSSDKKPK